MKMQEVLAVSLRDFRLIPQSLDSQNNYFQHWLKEAQRLQRSANMSLTEVFSCGFNFMSDYFRSEAWNENKKLKENDETIKTSFITAMNNIIKCLNGR